MFTPLTGRRGARHGGTRGIGKGIAGVFAGAGCHVVITGRDGGVGEAAAAELTQAAGEHGGTVAFLAGDLADAADCVAVTEQAIATLAGSTWCARRRHLPAGAARHPPGQQIDDIFAINVRATMLVVTPHSRRSRRRAAGG